MAENNYTPVEDGWKDGVKPCYVAVAPDHFDEDSLVLELSFSFGEGAERPRAKLPLVYSGKKVIVKWKDGVKTEHKVTAEDQREAFAVLAALFPAWVEYNKKGHATQDMVYWFENEGRETVLGTAMDIKVSHSSSGFPNATVKDPRNARKAKPKVAKADALTRAAAAFKQMFGSDIVAGNAGGDTPAPRENGDDEIPF